MPAVPYSLGQSDTLSIALPQPLVTIAGSNPTGLYVHFPGLPPPMDWVFPYTYGFTYPLPAWAASINATTRDTPPGFPPPPTDTGQVTLVAYDYPLPYSAGRQALPAQQWVKVGSKTLAAGLDSITTSQVPATTKTIAFLVEGGGTGIIPTHLDGVQSATRYWEATIPVAQSVKGMTMIPVDGQRDTSYTLTVATGNSLTVSMYASDALVTTASQGYSANTYALPVYVTNGGAGSSVSVELGPTSQALTYARTSQVGVGTSALVAGALGQSIYGFGGNLEVTTAIAGAFIALEDSASNIIVHAPASTVGLFAFQMNGAVLAGSNVGLQLRISGGAANGSLNIAYSQL